MTPQELKNSILQLAIQGKLVEQRPEEGTAEELYQQIQAEKQRLIKECKIKKEKPLPEVTEDEIPFDIPENWKWIKLGNVVSVLGGKRIPAGRTLTTVNTGHKYIRVSDMKNGSIQVENLMYVPEDIYPSISKYIINKEDIYITVAGTIGKVGKIPDKLDGANLTENADRLVFSLLDQDWLIKTLESAFVQTQIADATTKVGQPKLAIKRIQEIIIPLPPLAEQKRIVAKIDELLPYIERYERAWSKLEELNKRFPIVLEKSILEMAIQGKLVEQRPEEGTGEELYQQIQDEKQRLIKEGKIKKEKPLPEITEDEIPFDIPESWKWVRVSSIVTLNPKNDIHDDTEVGFVPMPLVSDGFKNQHTFDIKKWKNIKSGFTHFANNDIGIAKITPCFQNRKSVIFKDLPNGFGAGTTELSIVRVINDSLCREYLLWFFKTDYFITNGVKSFTGTAGQQRIHKDYLATCLIPLPPIAEQKRIVAKLEEILPLCEKLKK
jgi:type I restriction enzyme S subunit